MTGDLTDLLPLAAAWFAVFVFSTTLHEAAHAWTALRLGDQTAYAGGQVSLNPAPHMQREPFGMILVPLLSFFLMNGQWMIGWASAPYDPVWAQRHPRKSAIMAAAGPLSNLLLVALAGIAIRVGLAVGYLRPPSGDLRSLSDLIVGATEAPGSQGVATVLGIAFLLNLVLFLFNLLPLPPMDGSAILVALMSRGAAVKYQHFMRQPMWAIVGLLLAWRVFPFLFTPVLSISLGLLYLGV